MIYISLLTIIGLLLYTWFGNNLEIGDKAIITTAISTGALALYTAIYAWFTRKMATQMEEQKTIETRPYIIQKAVAITETELRAFGSRDWFSHFEIYNAGNGPAIELEISLLDKEKIRLNSHRYSFLRSHEDPVTFHPYELFSLEESSFYLVSEYKSTFFDIKRPLWYQTILPFKTIKTKEIERIFIEAGELEFYEVNETNRLDAFQSRSKPK
jgi:hypothetical protein